MSLAVLVIEGDRAVARPLVEVFTQQGGDAYAPQDVPSAMGALLGHEHDELITVSYRLSQANGTEIIRLIRELDHRKHTPVLMVPGCPEVTDEALKASATEVLYKPFEPCLLVSAVMRSVPTSAPAFH